MPTPDTTSNNENLVVQQKKKFQYVKTPEKAFGNRKDFATPSAGKDGNNGRQGKSYKALQKGMFYDDHEKKFIKFIFVPDEYPLTKGTRRVASDKEAFMKILQHLGLNELPQLAFKFDKAHEVAPPSEEKMQKIWHLHFTRPHLAKMFHDAINDEDKIEMTREQFETFMVNTQKKMDYQKRMYCSISVAPKTPAMCMRF